MKIAEALMERKDLTKKISRIKENILSNLLTRADLAPKESYVMSLLIKYNKSMDELEKLNKAIDKANIKIQDELNYIKILDSKIAFYKEAGKKLLEGNSSYMYSEMKAEIIKNYDIDLINNELEKLENERREIEKKILKINWETSIEAGVDIE